VRPIIEMTPAAEATIQATALERGKADGRSNRYQLCGGGYELCVALFGDDVAFELWYQSYHAGRRQGQRQRWRERSQERRAERKRQIAEVTS
jgi:hypothetical protein